MLGGVLFARGGWEGKLCEGMADEGGVDSACAVERLLEGEDDHHAVDALLHPAQAAALPGPELRTDKVDDGDVEGFELAGEAEVDVREVDENGGVGVARFDGGYETAVGAVDLRHVPDDLGDAHVGDVFGADDAVHSGLFHLASAETEEGRVWKDRSQRCDDLRPVVVSAGFTSREKDA